MSKLTIGMVAAGAVLASAVAVSVVAASGPDSASDVALPTSAGVEVGAPATGGAADLGGKDAAQSVTKAAAQAAAKAAAQQKAAGTVKGSAVAKAVRSAKVMFPTASANVGTNVTGSIYVADTSGKVVNPVPGAAVALQQLRGKVYVTLADGTTGDNGMLPVSFTSKTNSSWRAEFTSAAGKKTYSPVVLTKASALVTWASRPDMDVAKGSSASYSFRVNSETPVTSGHLELASSKTPTKWVALKNVPASAAGVVVQGQKFTTAGTWLLRGATAASATNVAGYTTSLEIVVK